MSRRNKKSAPTPVQPMGNDLNDWATIGLIVVASSLLVWGPLIVA